MTVRLKPSMKIGGRIILDRFIPEINLSNNTVAENASIGTVVGTATVQNAGGSTFTFELVDEGGTGDFSITPGGDVQVVSALNHEDRSVYPVQIKSVDSRGHKYAIATNLIVGDVNEPPVDINLSNNEITIGLETSGVSIGTATAIDPDASDPKTWSLINDASGQFTITSATGELFLNSYVDIHETNYTIEIQVEDSGSNIYSEQFVITLSARETIFNADTLVVGQRFGNDVVLNSDATTMAASAVAEDISPEINSGAVYIYTRSGSSWSLQKRLDGPGPITSHRLFGNSVDLSDSGDTLIVGSYLDDVNGTNAGRAHVYTRSGTTWSYEQAIESSDLAVSDFFGWDVSIVDSGDKILVTALKENTGASHAGAAYIFTRSGTTWTQQQKIQSTPVAVSAEFGYSGDIDSDGDTIIIGAHTENSNTGAAYVFTEVSAVWSQQQKLVPSISNIGDVFGWAVSISGDGDTAVVTAIFNDELPGLSNTGRAHIFTRSGSTWTEQAVLEAPEPETNAFFGRSVSMSKDGNTVIVGARGENVGSESSAGAAYIFTRQGTSWILQTRLYASDALTNAWYGYSSELDDDGNYAVVGAVIDDAAGNNTGKVYIYDLS